MPFTMPTHRPITQNRTIHSTTHKFESQCNVRNNMANIGKIYPERNNLPQGVKDAIRYNESTTY